MNVVLFVDDEPKVLQGLQRQLRSMRHEWEMIFAESGPKALELIAQRPVDVVVTDMMMPGMDGAQLLSEVMKRHPNSVRLVLSGHADREAVLRLVGPAHQYLSKPCQAEELRAAIGRSLAMRQLLANEQLKQIASQIRCLPSLPSLHTQLAQELRNEDPSMERVAEIISRDLGMAAKILQLVNSAFFGLPQPATTLVEAVMYLGQATIQALVLSTQLFSQFEQKGLQGFSIDAVAQHCWMTGVLARRIANLEHPNAKIGDHCFLAGLLHDVGYLILANGLTEQYREILQAARQSACPVWEIEQSKLGATHAEVGAYLLGLWGLPTSVIEAVALHHRPSSCSCQGFSPVIAVHVANTFAHDRNRVDAEQPGSAIDLVHLAALGLDGRIEAWRSECSQES